MSSKCIVDSLNYMREYIGNDSCFTVADNIVGIYCMAFCKTNVLKKITLPASTLYCEGGQSSFISDSIEQIEIYNATFTGVFNSKDLPALKRIDILDDDEIRIAHCSRLVSSIVNSDVECIYFPNVNLYACDKSDLSDIKLCINFLRNKELYTEKEQYKFLVYINKHTSKVIELLIAQKDFKTLRILLDVCDAKSIKNNLELIQNGGNTEITAIAIDKSCNVMQDSSEQVFDVTSLLDFSDVFDSKPSVSITNNLPHDELKTTLEASSGFEIRGIEDNIVVLGAASCGKLGVIYPNHIGDFEVEGIGMPKMMPSADIFIIAVEDGVAAIYQNAFIVYRSLALVYLPRSIQYIDANAFLHDIHKDTVIFCGSGTYAESWAERNGYRHMNTKYLYEEVEKYLTEKKVHDG